MGATKWGDTMQIPIGQASGLYQSFRLSAGLINLSTVVIKQSTETLHKYYVCGLETLTLGSSSAHAFVGSKSSSNDGSIIESSYAAWFTLAASASGATNLCIVDTYQLFNSD
jgi:hypothetical protein